MNAPEWTVRFAEDAVRDLELIEAHLFQAYRAFGESSAEARHHAEARVDAIIATAERLALAPMRGGDEGDLLPGLRHLTLDGAVYWFLVEDGSRQLRVLAVFFGGQDHRRHMLVRLLQKPPR